MKNPEKFVLKPQREGGGKFLIYFENIIFELIKLILTLKTDNCF